MIWKNIFILFFLCAWVSIGRAESVRETWNIVVDEFPPFTCVRCPDGGAGIKALSEALQTVNIDIVVTYLPFVHVLREARSQKYLGYFSWLASMQSGYANPSKALFLSRLTLVEQKNHPLVWKELSDLKGKRIGLYEGSGYFEEFMDLVNRGVITVLLYPGDDVRIRLVAQGKLDGALMDRDNAIYHIKQLQSSIREKVQVSEHILHTQGTYFVIQKKHAEKMKILEKALGNVDTQKIVDDYLLKYQQ
ncbi:substrate-binding periplasmic protein [Bdellovibrio svalbardensis]|uniref:Transporter substrate-binding domain-containing protein n=1 Tax=Bdellovibrio svalbardensis TaxID=2972972 RepID=A0ABT6DGC2_9BACT|nr:transporter substrate-binding domain-containing protein [Bdellovibrio svalbardensis]MDG0815909.1 transporter substrate-binding domain-containing protein [Bdellovibrio svalbardensis]